jgi:hypothetical protein
MVSEDEKHLKIGNVVKDGEGTPGKSGILIPQKIEDFRNRDL